MSQLHLHHQQFAMRELQLGLGYYPVYKKHCKRLTGMNCMVINIQRSYLVPSGQTLAQTLKPDGGRNKRENSC